MFYSPYQIWISVAVGAISAFMAWKRGKNPYLWFLLGAFLGIFGLIFLIYSKPRKGHQKNSRKDPNTIDVTPRLQSVHQDKFWYYLDPANQQEGPMSFDALSRALSEGKINPKTYIWNDGLENWKPLSDFLKT